MCATVSLLNITIQTQYQRTLHPTSCAISVANHQPTACWCWGRCGTFLLRLGNTKQNSKLPSVTTNFSGPGSWYLWWSLGVMVVTWVPHRSLLPVLIKFRSILLERRGSPKMLSQPKKGAPTAVSPAMCRLLSGKGSRISMSKKNRCTFEGDRTTFKMGYFAPKT